MRPKRPSLHDLGRRLLRQMDRVSRMPMRVVARSAVSATAPCAGNCMIYSLGFVCAATARELSWRSWAASRPVCQPSRPRRWLGRSAGSRSRCAGPGPRSREEWTTRATMRHGGPTSAGSLRTASSPPTPTERGRNHRASQLFASPTDRTGGLRRRPQPALSARASVRCADACRRFACWSSREFDYAISPGSSQKFRSRGGRHSSRLQSPWFRTTRSSARRRRLTAPR